MVFDTNGAPASVNTIFPFAHNETPNTTGGSPGDDDIVHPDALDFLIGRQTMLHQLIELVKAMGMPFAPKFYLSLEDWMLQYAEDTMEDLHGLF